MPSVAYTSAVRNSGLPIPNTSGGGGEIRTLETLSSLPPFQGGGINHYPTPPIFLYTEPIRSFDVPNTCM